MRKTIKRRLDDLEAAKRGGEFYMVTQSRHDNLYHFRDGEIMNEKKFLAWKRSLSDDDYLLLITYRDSEKEKEHE